MSFTLGFAGIPEPYFAAISLERAAFVESDAEFIGVELPQGENKYTDAYIDEFIARFAKRLRKSQHNSDTNGYAALYVVRDEVSTQRFVDAMFPSILPVPVLWRPVYGSNREIREEKNNLTVLLRHRSRSAKSALKALKAEFAESANRTPFLLPTHNFSSNHLMAALTELQAALIASDDPVGELRTLRTRFERLHPPKLCRLRNPPQHFFEDARRVLYRAPGKALHGVAHPHTQGHPDTCVLAARRRLGAAFHHAFHYDCRRDSQPVLRGDFHQCHFGIQPMTGNPHLNIAPNDYVRA